MGLKAEEVKLCYLCLPKLPTSICNQKYQGHVLKLRRSWKRGTLHFGAE